MLVPVMLLGTGCETAARELQGRLGHFPKWRLRPFTKRLVRAYVSFDKASEQIHSVLYAFGHRHRRKVARLFQRHLSFTDRAPKNLPAKCWISRLSTISRSEYSQSNCSMKSVRETNFGPVVISSKELGGGARLKWNFWPIGSISRRCLALSRWC